jgi:7-cyano-7-deazaguanine synthase
VRRRPGGGAGVRRPGFRHDAGHCPRQAYHCHALSFDYGQRHRAELDGAARVARSGGAVAHRVVAIDLSAFGGSALTDPPSPCRRRPSEGIPITYVPARNTVFLSLALAWAEVLGADDIFIGVNAVDYSGYPDCRPEFIDAFQRMARLATRAGVEGARCASTPRSSISKADIIRRGLALGVDYADTVSCYQPDR